MSLGRWQVDSIYLYKNPVDMRKGADSLVLLISEEMQLDVFSSSLFVFVSRDRAKIKLLVWERNGFWLLSKKLLKQKYKLPKWFTSEKLTLSEQQLMDLLSGYDLNGMRPHETLVLQHIR